MAAFDQQARVLSSLILSAQHSVKSMLIRQELIRENP
jgi:hypothetical protein